MPKKEERYNVPLTISEILTLEHLSRMKINNLAKKIARQERMNERTYSLKERVNQYDRLVTILYKSRTIKRTREEESLEYLNRTLGKEDIIKIRKAIKKIHRKRNYR